MPIKPPHTKPEKQAAVHTVMSEFKGGKLHSGSKQGPKVKSRDQAVAIALSEAGESKPKYDRDAHFKGNPGFPSDPGAKSPPDTYKHHEDREKEVMGAGYEAHEKAEEASYGKKGKAFDIPAAKGAHGFRHTGAQKDGHLRLSGHSSAHRIGKK